MEKWKESHFVAIFRKSMRIIEWTSCILIAIMMLLIVYDVFLRYLFGRASVWISDFLTVYVIVYVTVFPAALLFLKGEHVTVDIVTSHLNSKQKYYLSMLTTFFCLIYAIVLTCLGWQATSRELTTGSAFPTSAWLPQWPAMAIIFISGILLTVSTLIKLVQLGLKKGDLSRDDCFDSSY